MKAKKLFQQWVNPFLFLAVLCNLSASSTAQPYKQKIDSMIRQTVNDPNGPGGVFLVSRHGQIIYQQAFGKSNLELNVPLSTQNVFQIGSMTKQFTAIAMLILEERGKLKVTDFISRYVPDYPGGDKISIHHLLTHTSGIKDFTKMPALRDIAQKEMTPRMMVDFFKNEPVDFAPGEKFEYNNSGYVLLGYIIETVSGQTYEEFIRQHIFEKAGMVHSFYASDRKIIPSRAYGYQKKETGYVNKTIISFTVPYASGALMSTAADMLRWQTALSNNTLLSEPYSKKAFTSYGLHSGEKISYGYGWHIKEINGMKSREHGGSVFGFKSMGVYIPSEDIYVLGLTNCDCFSPTQLTRDIASFVIANVSK